MTVVAARDVASCVLLGVAVVIVVASAVGVLVMPGAARKLHFVTPAAIVAPVAVAAAIGVSGGLDYGTGQAWLTVALMVFAAPFLSHATIRAIRAREDEAAPDEGTRDKGHGARPPGRGARS